MTTWSDERCRAVGPNGVACALSKGHGGDHWSDPAAAVPSMRVESTQRDVAGGMLELEKLRAKLIPFRIAGVAAAVAVLWFVLGPVLYEDNLLLLLGAIAVLPFVGLWLGNVVGLALLRG